VLISVPMLTKSLLVNQSTTWSSSAFVRGRRERARASAAWGRRERSRRATYGDDPARAGMWLQVKGRAAGHGRLGGKASCRRQVRLTLGEFYF
jgi:hypothetical protein